MRKIQVDEIQKWAHEPDKNEKLEQRVSDLEEQIKEIKKELEDLKSKNG